MCINKRKQDATAKDVHLQELKAYIIHGWLHEKENVAPNIQKYWPIKYEVAMLDGMVIKGK